MSNTFLIVQREYFSRVRKKSFIVMTILTPLLFGGIMAGAVWLAVKDSRTKVIELLDESDLFKHKMDFGTSIKIVRVKGPLENAKKNLLNNQHDGLLYIPVIDPTHPEGITLFSEKNLGLPVQASLEKVIRNNLNDRNLIKLGIDKKILEASKVNLTLITKKISEKSEEASNTLVTSGVGYFGAFLIYLFIFLYGVQVMRGVIEEKTNRIVEVVISSVRPFQLMAGKIIGIALVGITQFLLWVVLTSLVVTISTAFFTDSAPQPEHAAALHGGTEAVSSVGSAAFFSGFSDLPWGLILCSFLFFFIGGYLLYGAFFAAIGSAVDSETDTQQFMFPITLPLIFSIILAQYVVKEPDGPLAVWLSMIPFTSPVIMTVRVPFGVPPWQLLLSAGVLILTFWGATRLAGKVYRTGILMYGKKTTYKELMKWLFYKG